ncbi:MAG TPA: ATP-binding protein [Puia sp.]|jgi:signal transduction histidine kinase|nr:ATP-binding protein [Puia sp.]
MAKSLLVSCFILLLCNNLFARTYTDDEARSAWNEIKKNTLTEENFKQTCDLIQDVAQTNINISYEILAQYLPIIRSTRNKQWVHVLLMNWAKAKESLTAFDEADSLYKLARENAFSNSKNYDEALVGTVLMYLEWDKKDSLQKYLAVGEKFCLQNNDKENLSFIYTFKAMSELEDTAFMKKSLDSAVLLAENLPNKNALFTAKYNRAIFYSQFNLQQQVNELDELLELTKDSSLSYKPKLYERTAFYFRNPAPSIYYQLMLVDLLLTDYDNAWKFAELFYDATVKPNPNAPQAAGFNSVMAMVKTYQGEYGEAKNYLSKSYNLFHLLGNKISYPTYNLAAGMLAEHEKNYSDALNDYALAYKNSSMAYGLHLMPPEIYYAHALILNQKFDSAQKLFSQLEPIVKTRTYSAIGYYYYKYHAELMKAKGDNAGYNKTIETFYAIKDSLTNFNHYRAIQEVETRMRVHDKELQITKLNDENATKQKELRTEKIFLVIFSSLAAIIIALLIAYSQNQLRRKQQAEQITAQNEILQQNKIIEIQKQHRIDVMQGAIDAEENERHKIADQLHDETGAMLALASLNISSVLEKGKDDLQSQEKIEKAHEILTTVSSSIRDISHRLTPLLIEKYGFKKAIEDMAHPVNLSGKLKLETVVIGFDDDSKYPISLINNLFRIIQELVHNILKHAHASNAMLELVEHANHISIMVEDNGIGIDDFTEAKGNGIKTIQSKIAYLNGDIEIQKKKDKGTLIVIEINV